MPQILDLKNFDLKKIPSKFHDALFILFYKLGIDGNEFLDDFMHGYIAYAYSQSNKHNDIHLSTGFGRRYIQNYINNIKSRTNPLKKISHKTLIKGLMEVAETSPDGIITIRGKENSFNAVFSSIDVYSKDITARAMMDKLIRVGVIERINKRYLRFITYFPTSGLNEADDIIRQLADNLNRLCHTLLYNMDVESHDNGLTQLSIWSDRIIPEKKESCINDLREETRNYFKNCERILLSNEQKGLDKKEVEALGIELGVSAFIFNNPK